MSKRIILVGAAASGKDFLKEIFINRGYKYSVSHTTRPIRQGEIPKKDYYFIESEYFEILINRAHFYEWQSFNGWYYGTSKDEFNDSNLFIMTPSGISNLREKDRKESLIIFLDVSEDIRKERLMKRGDADSVERRLEADRKDFKDFKDYDIRITDFSADSDIYNLKI